MKWTTLRAIGNSQLAKSTILVPILGYFVLFNKEILQWLQLHVSFCGAGGCDVFWRTEMLYFGSCAFAAGAILYALFCPHAIKKYGDSSDYIAGEQTVFGAHPDGGQKDLATTGDLDERLSDYQSKRLAREREVRELARLGQLPRPIPDLEAEDATKLLILAQRAFWKLDKSRPIARFFTASLYLLGAVLVGAPTLITFCEVFYQIVVRRLPL